MIMYNILKIFPLKEYQLSLLIKKINKKKPDIYLGKLIINSVEQ